MDKWGEVSWTDREISLLDDLEITSNLEQEWREHPSKYARWAFLYARAEDELGAANERLDLTFSILYDAYKKNYPDAKENEAKSYVRKHKKYRQVQTLRREKQLARDTLRGGLKSFEAREKMLGQLGAQSRHEENATRGLKPTPQNPQTRRKKQRSAASTEAANVIAAKRKGESENG